jgi:dephospho-CoA kinase
MLKYGIAGNSACGKTTFCNIFQQKHRKTSVLELDDCKLWKAMDKRLSNWDYANEIKTNYSAHKPMTERSQKLCTFVNEIIISHIKNCENDYKPDFILFDWFLLPYVNVWKDFDKRIIITADSDVRYKRMLAHSTLSVSKGIKEWAESDFVPPDVSYDVIVENNDAHNIALNEAVDRILLRSGSNIE